MTRTRSSVSEDGESLDMQVSQFENTMKNAPSMMSTDDKISAIFKMFRFMFLERKAETEQLKQLNNQVSSLKKEVVELQYELCKNKVRIQGLPLHTRAENGRETVQQTTENFNVLKGQMGCTSVSITDVVRMPPRRDKPDKAPAVVVTFYSLSDKFDFMGSLSNLKNNKNAKKVTVDNEYPRALSERLRTLQEIAFKQRKLSIKTSIRYRNADLVLFVKKSTESTYSKYNEEK